MVYRQPPVSEAHRIFKSIHTKIIHHTYHQFITTPIHHPNKIREIREIRGKKNNPAVSCRAIPSRERESFRDKPIKTKQSKPSSPPGRERRFTYCQVGHVRAAGVR
jgi:hypothetical protein